MNKKMIFVLVLSCLIFCVSVGYASDIILSKNVYYNNGSSGLKSLNVQEAIDELYNRSNNNTCESVSKPNLGSSNLLIPVTIAGDGVVTYVSGSDPNWYNYCDKRWANAVILEDDKAYKVGDVISEDDIESYFVWIPKYKYKLWNTGTALKNAHEIEIVFDEENTTDIEGYSCATPLVSGESGNCQTSEYMTHPAFITMDTNGFWVGKFETGYRGATKTSAAQVSTSDSESVIIKPNAYSWRKMTVYNMFLTSYNYERELESHMMKNTEWGAVAYLSHSKYGIDYEVNINNNSSFKTGYSALPSTNQQSVSGTSGDGDTYNQPYNTEIGYLASTTGNISGIYDMAGGAHEYVASYRSGGLASSGFTTTTTKDTYIGNYDDKYFDVYNTSSSSTTYEYRILGDATGEMGPFKNYSDSDGTSRYHNSWYNDVSGFLGSSNSWFYRGGLNSNGVTSGQFHFHKDTGAANSNITFRIVLTP